MNRNTILIIIALLVTGGLSLGLMGANPNDDKPLFVTTINPLRSLVAEIAGDQADVKNLLPAGASPHAYEPKPSDAIAVSRAKAFFHVSESLDGWAVKLGDAKPIAVLPLLPQDRLLKGIGCPHDHDHGHHHHHGHDHSDEAPDPHFWTDPLMAAAMTPVLAKQMAASDPDGAETYRANAKRLEEELLSLHQSLISATEDLQGKPVVTFHPSFNYYLKRYGLRLAGVVEASPGQQASPKELKALIDLVKNEGVRAVFTEPQLPRRPAELLSEAAGVKLYELDPIGGSHGRESYMDLMRYNTEVFRKALTAN